ncbi:GNAT family N-acetyltransferase [Enterococcus ureilyticus]|uniref:GNAT family N-acetyltransferase n=1 Tax=Enterococcus ureilyticus TaxID=1131292 RepID=A0A1E5HFA8_9ENTE|nr:GNAT family N-acetyltransferase [Enterococcus ureilyticus]MBM7689270.1 putative acetyltransferase [Enterococcus ureilyticus]MBO0446399.1 GNAT family N-acetyltransferase [Enterococcus ureilyticus]OEG23546.1 GNAT family N-acetyltransferase [Enterococcus ureilyticus]
MTGFNLRNYQKSDLETLLALFNGTIQAINKKDYTPQQIEQWVQLTPDYEKWHAKLDTNYTVVAQNRMQILGFGSISDSGKLDYLYVGKEWIGYGVGKLIANDLIAHAFKAGAKEITVYSSITAKPFFESLGFESKEQKINYRNGVLLMNYLMVYRKDNE